MASQLNPHQQQQHPHQATSSSGEVTPCEGKPIVHERQDSEKDMRDLFDTLVARQRPMRERQLPSSFFSPSTAAGWSAVPAANNAGHHSREGSTDSSYSSQSSSMQSPAHHFRSVSEPVVPSRMVAYQEPLPAGWQMAVTPQGQRYFLNHITKSTTWQDPRTFKQYAPVTQQQPRTTALSRAPLFPQAGGAGPVTTSSGGAGMGHLGGGAGPIDGLQLDASATFMQQFGGTEPFRQRSTSWIDPRATGGGGIRSAHAQRQLHLAKHRLMLQQQQQQQQQQVMLRQQQQRELMHMSGMTTDELMTGGLIPGPGVAPLQAAAAHREALQRDPFMPVTGSVSPDIALQLSASSPASSALSHVREGSTDSGFGLGGVETGLGHVGLDPGNQYDPMVGNAGLFASFNNHSMSPIPSMGSPRPASAASGSASFLRQAGQQQQQQHDLAAMTAGLDAGLIGAAGMPMDTDDLSAVLNDSDLLNLDNDPMLLQTLL